MKKSRKLIMMIIIIILVVIIGVYFLLPYLKPIKSGVVWQDNQVSEREGMLLSFIDTKLKTDDGGIKTNYINSESIGDITKGHSILSESQGIMLLYYIDRDRKGEFDNILGYIKDKMLLDSNVVSWRVENEEASPTSATIDDLRIVKALLLAEERWGDKSYRKLALKISRGIKKDLLDENLLADFNDGSNMSDKTTICYLDLQTMKLLSKIDGKYKDIYDESEKLINKAYISDELPLYKKEFNRKDSSFDNENIDMLLSSIVLLNRAEVGEDVSKSIEWLKNKYKNDNGIFSSYDKESGKTISNIESTSIYSNLLQIAVLKNDMELYNICLPKLEGYQVSEVNNEIYGAYGDANTKEVYSFDNLNALLAWRKVK